MATIIGRTATGTSHTNRVVIRRIKVIFQRFPGTTGTDADRGISGVAYKLKIDGRVATRGTTAADGSAMINVPAGSTAILEIFDTQYTIQIVNALEPLNTRHGEQRRLQLLGYELGEVDGHPGVKTNFAVMNFQADNNPLDPNGTINDATRNQLRTKFGA